MRDERDDSGQLPPLPSNPREAALRILQAVETRKAFSDRLLDGAHARGGPEPRDQALMHELVKGTLRWRGRLDWALDPRIHIGLSQVQPWARNVLRLGAYQILFLDRVPPHAAVDESVKLAQQFGHPGTAGLVNSVLRRLVDEKDTIQWPEGDDAESLAVWGSHPRWMVERWLARFGAEATRALMLANNRPARSGLRVNTVRGTREQLIARLAEEGAAASAARLANELVWLDSPASPAALAAFKKGYCTVQDESETLVGALVDARLHDRILDLCAAPGGKCTHLAERMGDEGEVWALEKTESRVPSLNATVERLGLHCIHVVEGDGRSYEFPMPFDRVLVDAPCSGLGVLGRRADARWRKGPEVLREMPPIQLELLLAGGRRARPGGVLVYSVCSFEPEETTELVERFLRQSPQFVLETASGLLPDEVVGADGFMHVLPHVHGCDGAFAARFRRT
ncbi:MAG: 16S rRNA (cytosine(967)-C(5))-methyltransferase RsmB [Candidatus Eiseniibacteriota bacterium]